MITILISGCVFTPDKAALHKPAQVYSGTVSSDKSPYFNYLKAELLKQRGDQDQSIDTLKKAIKNDPDSAFLRKEMITLYLHQHDAGKALEAAQAMVDRAPDDTDGLFILAKLNQMLHHENEAMDLYHTILQLKPDNKKIYLILGRLYMEKKNIDDAFNLYSQMAKRFPDSYTAHFFLGKIHSIKQNPDYAEKEFLQSLKINPDLVEPRFELIKIYKAEGSEKSKTDVRIIKLYKKILEIEPSDINALLELPLYYYDHNEKEKADEIFIKIGKKYSGSHEFYMKAAREFIKTQKYREASIIFTGLLKGDPDNSNLHYLAGISYDGLEQTKKAIKQFLSVKPDSIYYRRVILHLAFLYNESGQRKKALQILEKKHAEFPEDIDIMLYLSSFYEEGHEFDKALDLLNKGIKISPENAELLFRRGIVQDKAGGKNKCIESMKKVIKIDPDNSSALNYLGYTYAEMGTNLDQAEELIIRALKLKPDDGFITDSLGWVYFKKGLYKKAVKILTKAARLSSCDPVICEHLGDAYQKNKEYKKALKIYKKALLKSKKNKTSLINKIRQLNETKNLQMPLKKIIQTHE